MYLLITMYRRITKRGFFEIRRVKSPVWLGSVIEITKNELVVQNSEITQTN